MANLKQPKIANGNDFVARAQRAMIRAGERAMADYKNFGVEPVIGKFRKREDKTHNLGKSDSN